MTRQPRQKNEKVWCSHCNKEVAIKTWKRHQEIVGRLNEKREALQKAYESPISPAPLHDVLISNGPHNNQAQQMAGLPAASSDASDVGPDDLHHEIQEYAQPVDDIKDGMREGENEGDEEEIDSDSNEGDNNDDSWEREAIYDLGYVDEVTVLYEGQISPDDTDPEGRDAAEEEGIESDDDEAIGMQGMDPSATYNDSTITQESLVQDDGSGYYHTLDPGNVEIAQLIQGSHDFRRENLNDDELDNLIGFALQSNGNLSEKSYEMWRLAYAHRMNLETAHNRDKLVQQLSGLSSQTIHCCRNSCIAYNGEYADFDTCPHCQEPQRDGKGRPQNTFHPIPLIPRLQGMYQDAALSHSLNRENHPPSDPDIIGDKFDGDHVQELRKRNVIVDGKDTGYKYFADGRDIGFSIALDGFTFFETVGKHTSKMKYNTWLIIAIIDSLDPLIRCKRRNIMILGVIPGPGSPKDMNSYFPWFRNELRLLSIGILTWDAAEKEFFLLRAFLLFVLGDMPAIAYIMNMKGHNGLRPCRSCYIRGLRNQAGGEKVSYPVLLQLDGQSFLIKDLLNQYNRTHQDFLHDVAEIEAAKQHGTQTKYKGVQKDTGIKGRSILMDVDSIDFGRSFPHDLMHLAGLNTIPNLVMLWTGTFPTLSNFEPYLVSKENWKIVGQRTEQSSALIPSEFSRAIPNIAQKPSMNAEAWFFWFIAIAPYALDGILMEPYYQHAMDLVKIIRRCQAFSITREEVEGSLARACHKWVEDYERLYYQGKPECLSACKSTVHAWIHISRDILNAGPAWTNWAFPMEREVQWAKSLVQYSRRQPFSFLTSQALQREQVKQLGYRLGIADRLKPIKVCIRGKGPVRETQLGLYRDFILCSPVKRSATIDETVRSAILTHLSTIYESHGADRDGLVDTIEGILPRKMERWGRAVINGGGDTISGSESSTRERDASFARYHVVVSDNNDRVSTLVCYGQVHHILKFTITSFESQPPRTFILALIRPCETRGLDATIEKTYYSAMDRLGVVDLTCLVAAVGRVPMGDGRYGIVDRSTEESWPSVHESSVDPQV